VGFYMYMKLGTNQKVVQLIILKLLFEFIQGVTKVATKSKLISQVS